MDQNLQNELMTDPHIARHFDQATALSEDDLRAPTLPVPVAVEEAEGLAFLADKCWEPTATRPGLREVQAFVPRTVIVTVRSEAAACRRLQTYCSYAEVDTTYQQLVDRATAVEGELAAHLAFVLEDGVATPSDTVLSSVVTRRGEESGTAQLAQRLADLVLIARKNQVELAKLEGFDAAQVDAAERLSDALTAEGKRPRGRPASEVVELRNRYLTLLERDVAWLRRAIRYVFRDHPELVRQAGSEYKRRRRAAQRDPADATTQTPQVQPAEQVQQVEHT